MSWLCSAKLVRDRCEVEDHCQFVHQSRGVLRRISLLGRRVVPTGGVANESQSIVMMSSGLRIAFQCRQVSVRSISHGAEDAWIQCGLINSIGCNVAND